MPGPLRKDVVNSWWIHVRLKNDRLETLGEPFDTEEDAYAASRALLTQYPDLFLSQTRRYRPVPNFQAVVVRLPLELRGAEYVNLREEIRRAMGDCAAARHFPNPSITEQQESLQRLSLRVRRLHRDLRGSPARVALEASGSDERENTYLAAIRDLKRLDELLSRASDALSSAKAKRPDVRAWRYVFELLAIFEQHSVPFDLKKGALLARVLDLTLPAIGSKFNAASALKKLKQQEVSFVEARGTMVPKKTRR
ncbi:MAG: hypothetical protein WKH97_04140 [Casimicrobiaceae bacterium]